MNPSKIFLGILYGMILVLILMMGFVMMETSSVPYLWSFVVSALMVHLYAILFVRRIYTKSNEDNFVTELGLMVLSAVISSTIVFIIPNTFIAFIISELLTVIGYLYFRKQFGHIWVDELLYEYPTMTKEMKDNTLSLFKSKIKEKMTLKNKGTIKSILCNSDIDYYPFIEEVEQRNKQLENLKEMIIPYKILLKETDSGERAQLKMEFERLAKDVVDDDLKLMVSAMKKEFMALEELTI